MPPFESSQFEIELQNPQPPTAEPAVACSAGPKILFLDIDGVLNSTRSCLAHGGYPHQFSQMKKFDLVALGLIQRLCRIGHVEVVLSSTWRYTYSADDAATGLDLPVIDCTPRSHSGVRGLEINTWLSQHPDVSCYAIVDDDSDMLPDQMPRFVQTDHRDGFTLDNYLQLCALLDVEQEHVAPLRRTAC